MGVEVEGETALDGDTDGEDDFGNAELLVNCECLVSTRSLATDTAQSRNAAVGWRQRRCSRIDDDTLEGTPVRTLERIKRVIACSDVPLLSPCSDSPTVLDLHSSQGVAPFGRCHTFTATAVFYNENVDGHEARRCSRAWRIRGWTCLMFTLPFGDSDRVR